MICLSPDCLILPSAARCFPAPVLAHEADALRAWYRDHTEQEAERLETRARILRERGAALRKASMTTIWQWLARVSFAVAEWGYIAGEFCAEKARKQLFTRK